MFFNKNSEQDLLQLMIRVDALDREVKGLLDELQVTPEQVSTFLADPENFTQENWEELQQQRKTLDEKLKRDMENIRNPSKTQKAQADRHVARHWLYVK